MEKNCEECGYARLVVWSIADANRAKQVHRIPCQVYDYLPKHLEGQPQ